MEQPTKYSIHHQVFIRDISGIPSTFSNFILDVNSLVILMNLVLVIVSDPVSTHKHMHGHLRCGNSAQHTYMWICHN